MENDRYRRTRRMILTRAMLVPLVLVLAVCGTLVYYFAANLRLQVASRLERIADEHRRSIETFLDERVSDLMLVSSFSSFEDLAGKGRLGEALERLQAGSPAFLDLGVFDEQGNHAAYNGPYDLKGRNYAQTEWFKEVRSKNVYVSDVFLGYRNIPHFIIAVKKKEGDRTWYLRATIDTLSFNNLVESIRVGKTGEAYLVNNKGKLQTRRRSGGDLMQPDPDRSIYRADGGDVVSFAASDHAGTRHLYATGGLRRTGWVLVVRQEIGDAYAPLARAVAVATVMVAAGGAVVMIMAFLLASGLAHQLTVADLEKRQMGSQLIQAGKLAEVGELSSAMAHEINNPLQIMTSENTLITDILDEAEGDPRRLDAGNFKLIRESADQINIQIARCKKLTQGLLKFARKSETRDELVHLQPLIEEVVGMIDRSVRLEDIRIVRELEPGLPPVIGDRGQLTQVFLNLINNAVYALGGREKGVIRIHGSVEDGHLCVAVADNGCGIKPENMEKIFLPFFTTKPAGQGTGLGLSTSYSIVERAGGRIKVGSEPNVGTVFTVQLPLDRHAGERKSERQHTSKEEPDNG
ncbi:MAG: ATP-binding protein [Pseudomonadota bacterium]